jgi:hypothetical protein
MKLPISLYNIFPVLLLLYLHMFKYSQHSSQTPSIWKILKGSNDGVCHSGLLGFSTLSIVWYSREHYVSETKCFRPQVSGWKSRTLLGPLERADSNHWTTVSETLCTLEYRTMDKDQNPSNPEGFQSDMPCFKPT